jgi:CRP-like cAMP-binding protein
LAAVAPAAGNPADRELLFRQFPEAAQEYVSVDMDQGAFWELMRTRLLDRDATIVRRQIFDGLSEAEMRTIASLGHVVGSRAGDPVVIGREPGREVFLILDGTYRIVAHDDTAAIRTLKVLGPGDIFGELAFLTNGLRSASVFAMSEGRLLVLNAQALDHLAAREPTAAAKFFRNLAGIVATRMRDAVKF